MSGVDVDGVDPLRGYQTTKRILSTTAFELSAIPNLAANHRPISLEVSTGPAVILKTVYKVLHRAQLQKTLNIT